LTGLVLKHTLLPGAITPFIMELPPYRLPTARNMLMLTWERLKSFIINAGKAIVLMVMVLSFFNLLGTDGSFGNENTDKSVLSNIGQTITPAFAPMGIEEKNWPATVGIFSGVFAKETIIASLNALYSQMDAQPEGEIDNTEKSSYQPLEGIKKAFVTVPENLKSAVTGIINPFGRVSTLSDIETVSENQGVEQAAISRIHAAFGTKAAVVAFLIFVLLYTPCVAALGAIYREAGVKWMALVAVWSFALAWSCATGYYQLSLLGSSPVSAGSWLLSLAVALVSVFFILRYFGRSKAQAALHSRHSRESGNPVLDKGRERGTGVCSQSCQPKAVGVCLAPPLPSRERGRGEGEKK
jgi:ferrous iron transport protein B